MQDERLWPGEFVNLRLILNMRRGVADRAVADRAGRAERHYAYVIKDDDTVERRPVEVAAVQDGIAVIDQGLVAGRADRRRRPIPADQRRPGQARRRRNRRSAAG